jgi:predicted dehydrogenase
MRSFGPLADLGMHHFDVMRWLVGAEVDAVSAEMTNSAGQADALEDNAIVSLSFSNGVVGQGYYSFVVHYCTEAGPLANMGWVDLPVTEPVPAFGLMLQHFADCVREGRQTVTVGEDGLRSVEIAEHAYLSAREGRPFRSGIGPWLGPSLRRTRKGKMLVSPVGITVVAVLFRRARPHQPFSDQTTQPILRFLVGRAEGGE